MVSKPPQNLPYSEAALRQQGRGLHIARRGPDLAFGRKMPFRAVAQRALSEIREFAIDEAARARGYDSVTIAADASGRAGMTVTEERDARAIQTPGGEPKIIPSTSIDRLPA
ncbi:MAG: hypothetical protein ACYCS1_10625 [Gammaproteobacteria bacterium]